MLDVILEKMMILRSRYVFMLGFALSFMAPLSLWVADVEWQGAFLDAILNVPGIASLAGEDSLTSARAIGIAISLIAAMLVGLALPFLGVDRAAMLRVLGESRYLYIAAGLLLVVVPWVKGGDVQPHQVSYGFFESMSQSALLFSTFCAGVYVYTSAILTVTTVIFMGVGRK